MQGLIERTMNWLDEGRFFRVHRHLDNPRVVTNDRPARSDPLPPLKIVARAGMADLADFPRPGPRLVSGEAQQSPHLFTKTRPNCPNWPRGGCRCRARLRA